ncbi:MAG: type II secretion system protein GspD [Candidatus Omnitrophica bacterium]|nr:type II secretion system protein GspD [Candidatus Omnitrophota bacterium]
MRLKCLFLFVTIFALIIFSASSARAQGEADPEYTLSVEEYLNSALPPQEGRSITFNEVTGILTVTDTPSNQRLIRKLIKQFDVGPRQVMIEAKFVEIEFEDLDEMGIEWYWYKHGDITLGDASTTTYMDTPQVGDPNDFIFSDTYKGVQWDTDANSPFPLSNFGLGFILSKYESGKFLTSYLRALASEGRANLLSSPKITTLSGQMANIQITQTIPYVSNVDFDNSGTAEHPIWQFEYTIEERVTGITLEVTPYVGGDSDIVTLEIHPEISNLVSRRPIFVGEAGNPFTSAAAVPALLGWPVIDTRTAQTSVMVKSGETVVMGGFVQDDDTVTKKKVPILGDIPLIGKLFRYDYKSRSKKNLVIFLTATLITAEGERAER